MKVVNGLYNMRKAKRSNWNSLLLTLKIVKAASKQNFWSNQKQAMKPIIHENKYYICYLKIIPCSEPIIG